MSITYRIPRNQSRLANTTLMQDHASTFESSRPLDFRFKYNPHPNPYPDDPSRNHLQWMTSYPLHFSPQYLSTVQTLISTSTRSSPGSATIIDNKEAFGHLFACLWLDQSKLPERYRMHDLTLRVKYIDEFTSAVVEDIPRSNPDTTLYLLYQPVTNAVHGSRAVRVFHTKPAQSSMMLTTEYWLGNADGEAHGETKTKLEMYEYLAVDVGSSKLDPPRKVDRVLSILSTLAQPYLGNSKDNLLKEI